MQTLSYIPRSSENVLKDVVQRVRRDPYGDFSPSDMPSAGAPEVILVKVPTLGIPPARSTIDTGYEFQAGKAECEIFYFQRSDALINGDGTLNIAADIYARPIKSPIFDNNQVQQPTKEWIYNPYRYRHYGSPAPAPVDNPNEQVMLFTTAYRDRSGFFVCERPPNRLKGKTIEDIQPNMSGYVQVWRGGVSNPFAETAWLNWMTGNQKVSSGKEVVIEFFEDERKWIITNAECETT